MSLKTSLIYKFINLECLIVINLPLQYVNNDLCNSNREKLVKI